MTANEIIDIWDSYKRMLKIHKDNVGGIDEREIVISQEVADGTYELLNRQKEEKETMQEYIDCLRAEIERLQKAIKVQDIMIEQQDYKIKTAKSEARKEFADKVYRFLCTSRIWNTLKLSWLWNGECEWLKQSLDNLLKEMEEEE